MGLHRDACYRAMVAHDERFDGVFYVAVSTTGVYCRPVCRARTPGRDRCTFYRTAAEAEREGYRACFRCRPELAPGSAPMDAMPRLVAAALARLGEGSLEAVARGLGVSARHLRRAMQAELGVSPVELVQTRRLALAKQLVRDTDLTMADIAFAAGFGSIRRMNALFRARAGRAPSELRRVHGGRAGGGALQLALAYRPPLDWDALLGFLAARALPGVEAVQDGRYLRTVRIGAQRGWVAVGPARGRHALEAEVSLSLTGVLLPLVTRLRRLFDLDAHPRDIAAHLARDGRLRRHVRAHPGLRVPGAFDGFEAALRAVLGQQVSVAAATTLAGRVVAALGDAVVTPHAALTRLAPPPERVAGASAAELARLGILPARAHTLRGLARALVRGELSLQPGDGERALPALEALPGIGPWTAHYLAMRALGWPDAFPDTDLGVRKALGVSGRAARVAAEPWRPWRAYAVMHLWMGSTT